MAEKKTSKKTSKSLIFWIVALVAVIFLLNRYNSSPELRTEEASVFHEHLESGYV